MVEFEWDETKDRTNQRKHGISFALAASVFLDGDRKERLDERSVDEERWITIGLVDEREMVVAYTMRGEAIRLISARGADRYEREDYWNREV
ncbi:MAG TPA: BrnT family toxin [Acidobacteriaceae bacterium]